MAALNPNWHPILTAIEEPVGVWTLHAEVRGDEERRPTGVVRLVRRGDEVRYRGELTDSTVVGYWNSLLPAARATHGAWLQTLGPGGSPNSDWEKSRVDRHTRS